VDGTEKFEIATLVLGRFLVLLLAVSLYPIEHKRVLVQVSHLYHLSVCVSVCLSVGRSVRKVYCGKTAEWIRVPFGVVSGVGRERGVLDGSGDLEGEGTVLGEFGASHCNQWGLCGVIILCRGRGWRLFPNYFGISCLIWTGQSLLLSSLLEF